LICSAGNTVFGQYDLEGKAPMPLRFTIRDLLWLTLVVALRF
jgi:hypothetical protein